MPAVCLSEARLQASDVGALVREAHPRGGGVVGGGQVGVPKGRPALRGLQLRGLGVVCRVEECAEWVRCSFLSAEGGVEPAASDSVVGCISSGAMSAHASGMRAAAWGGRGCGSGRCRSRWWRYRARRMWRAATFKPPPLWRKGGLWGGRGVLPVATAMVHAWSAASAG